MGKKGSGIYSIDDLRDRCWVDDTCDCWYWKGARKADGTPSMWIPLIGRTGTMSQALCVLTKGRPLNRGEHARWTCKTRFCANPKHNKFCDLSTLRVAMNIKRSPIYKAKMMNALRGKSSITDEQVAEIRNSSETANLLAQMLGISPSYVNKIRRGDRRLPMNGAPGSSVFSLGCV